MQVVIDFQKEPEQKIVVVQQAPPLQIQQQRQPYVNRIFKLVGHHLKRFKFF